MRATNSKGMDDGPGDIEALLPWYAAGTLSPRERRRVEDALGRDAALRRQYAAIREEYAETVALNEALGVPSVHALRNLMAAIEAEPARAAAPPPRLGRFTRFFAGLSPRTVAWSASFGAMALLLQAGVIGVILMRSGPETFRSDAYRQLADRMSSAPPVPVAPAAIPASPAPEREARSVPSPDRRELPPQALQADRSRANAVVSAQPQSARRSVALSSATPDSQPRSEVVAAVTFRPEARMSDISALLGSYRASVIGSRDGVLQLRFEGMTTDADLNVILAALSKERIVAKAVAVP